MDTSPPAIDTLVLRAALQRGWSTEPDDLTYMPKGGGSDHWRATSHHGGTYFVTVDDLDTKPWMGHDRPSVFAALTAAYGTAWSLRHDDGMALVVAPIRTDTGSVVVQIDDRYSVAMFPYIDGDAGEWGAPIAPDQREALLRELASLHTTTRARCGPIARRRLELPERDALLNALATLDRAWTAGPYSEPARRVLADNASDVHERLARFDELATQLARADADLVVSHGEPHPGNLIQSPTGLRMIDWDTVALAEPERDLWMLDNGADGLAAYTETTAYPVSHAGIEFYRLAWTMSDIASFTNMFRSAPTATSWLERKWHGFVALVEGASSMPYAPSEAPERGRWPTVVHWPAH